MLIEKCKALFKSEPHRKDVETEISEMMGDYVSDGIEKLYPTDFWFDWEDVVVVNRSEFEGCSTIRLYCGDFVVKLEPEYCAKKMIEGRELMENRVMKQSIVEM